ncbi:GIY-YIG nuclease family protein [Bacillus sp. USDA818B3_A]|uniref:GIY-YIG nuclease family protein n=1 Tax=Bacillus sp. USDA818B3_A TaxID=2698834 RepID=UPI001369240F|nr:GIY-YIG nuclease family protein [Bacillus sp. USDA818B3_A]
MGKLEINKNVLRKFNKIGLSLKFDEDTESAYLYTQFGDILTKEETIEVVRGLMNFVEIVDDNEIIEYNQQPTEYVDYHRQEFNHYRFLSRRKKGYVFIYKELVSNNYRFGETKEISRRKESLQNSSPAALDFVIEIYSEDTVSLKEFLQIMFTHRMVTNNWFALTEEDISYIRNKEFQGEFQDMIQQRYNKRKKEQFMCSNPSCGKRVTDEDQQYYYEYYGDERYKFCSKECVEAHFKKYTGARHLD